MSENPNEGHASLEALRKQIDTLDKELVRLLNERAEVVVKVGEVKRSGQVDTPIYAPDREAKVLKAIRGANQGPLPNRCLEAIWKELMSGSFHLERPLQIGFLGPFGSFSHLAAKLQFGASVEYSTVDDISSVFDAVEREHIDFGLVPIENSTGGGITDTLDTFLQTSARVSAEVQIYVHHNVMSLSTPDQIKKIYSRPEVFSQCRRWLGTHLTHADRITTASSAKAAEMAKEDPTTAAIGSPLAAELYGLPIQFANIEDQANNITRFFVISKNRSKPTGDDKTALMFTTAHKSGALVDVLDVFRKHGVNLTHIDKRPSQRVNWEYIFFIDCEGHIEDANVAAAVEETQKHCLYMTHLGSFPRAREVLG